MFPLPRVTAIAFRLNIAVTVPMNISQLHLRADWLKGPISWLKPCPTHFRNYCLHECADGGDVQFFAHDVLNGKIKRWERLHRGDHLRGFLLGTFTDPFPSTAGPKLDATVVIEDLFGEEYPFSIELSNHKEITRPISPMDGEVI